MSANERAALSRRGSPNVVHRLSATSGKEDEGEGAIQLGAGAEEADQRDADRHAACPSCAGVDCECAKCERDRPGRGQLRLLTDKEHEGHDAAGQGGKPQE